MIFEVREKARSDCVQALTYSQKNARTAPITKHTPARCTRLPARKNLTAG
ncbi:hypothetical protein [uncultured Ruminococcus sp.]|nr:hypothetical protein [uncultured Ruminococcus sp.]